MGRKVDSGYDSGENLFGFFLENWWFLVWWGV